MNQPPRPDPEHEESLDRTIEESFPASDPPSSAPAPKRDPDDDMAGDSDEPAADQPAPVDPHL